MRSPALAGLSFSCSGSDSATCPYRTSPFLPPAAQAIVVYGCVSTSTRLDPWGLPAVEIAIGNVILPGSVGHVQACPLTKRPALRKQPSAGLGPVTVHPTHSGIGPRDMLILLVSVEG